MRILQGSTSPVTVRGGESATSNGQFRFLSEYCYRTWYALEEGVFSQSWGIEVFKLAIETNKKVIISILN
jgi:hypothetical protein